MMIFLAEMLIVAALLILFRLVEEKARRKYKAREWFARMMYQFMFLVPVIVALAWLLSNGYEVRNISAIVIGAVIGLFGLDLLKLLKRKIK